MCKNSPGIRTSAWWLGTWTLRTRPRKGWVLLSDLPCISSERQEWSTDSVKNTPAPGSSIIWKYLALSTAEKVLRDRTYRFSPLNDRNAGVGESCPANRH